MIGYVVSVVLLWIVAGTLSLLSFRQEGLRDDVRFHLLGLVPLFGCLVTGFVLAFGVGSGGGAMNLATVGGILAYLSPMAMGALIAVPFVARAFTLFLMSMFLWFSGEHRKFPSQGCQRVDFA